MSAETYPVRVEASLNPRLSRWLWPANAHRWVLRAAAYAGLVTDRYSPFRLDMASSEPGGRLSIPPAGPGAGPGPAADGVPAAGPGAHEYRPAPPLPPGPPPPAAAPGWTAGRIIALVTGSVLILVSLGLLAGGALWSGPGRPSARPVT